MIVPHGPRRGGIRFVDHHPGLHHRSPAGREPMGSLAGRGSGSGTMLASERFPPDRRRSFVVPDIRKQRSYDGRWMVFIGSQIIVSDLSDAQVEALLASYRRVVLDGGKAE
ncbi:hypothetical protein [Methylobacterium tarhaniae]|uniref:hypothetical protein n=1 Tax=Methylobacterium tarhaniae TaxID=1187852 RepID=UPI003D058CC7